MTDEERDEKIGEPAIEVGFAAETNERERLRVQWDGAADRLNREAAEETERQMAEWRASRPVAQASAHLDAALKDLEDRGLLWWDRSANSYDLHPIVRAYVHDQLDQADRVRANTRVRDHFQALPAESGRRISSVDDLRRSITIYRALIGMGREGEARQLFVRHLEDELLVGLGALTTVVELLGPVRKDLRLANALELAYGLLGRYEEALSLALTRYEDALIGGNVDRVSSGLHAISGLLRVAGDPAAGFRAMDFAELIVELNHDQPYEDGLFVSYHARRALNEGRFDLASELAERAELLGPPDWINLPWWEDERRTLKLQILLEDGRLSLADLIDAEAACETWLGRKELEKLRFDLSCRKAEYGVALSAAQAIEKLERSAGCESSHAPQALALASLGLREEAEGALEEALSKMPRLQPADRPNALIVLTLMELGRNEEAVPYALAAYRAAWLCGPPNSAGLALGRARQILGKLGVPEPSLPITEPGTARLPLHDKLLEYITETFYIDATSVDQHGRLLYSPSR